MEEKVQSNTRMRTESELQLWEINAPNRKQTSRKQTAGKHIQRSQHMNQYRLVQTPGKTAANTNHARRSTGAGRPRHIESIKRRRARRQRVLIYRSIALGIFVLFLVGIFKLTGAVYRGVHARMQRDDIPAMEQEAEQETPKIGHIVDKPEITVNLLEPNP